MEKVYISGPMTGIDNYEKMFNDAAELLQTNGFLPLNPVMFPPGLSFRDYIHLSIALLDIADKIYMLPGWESSLGARAEKSYADKAGIEEVKLRCQS